jgi:hypothetical protein
LVVEREVAAMFFLKNNFALGTLFFAALLASHYAEAGKATAVGVIYGYDQIPGVGQDKLFPSNKPITVLTAKEADQNIKYKKIIKNGSAWLETCKALNCSADVIEKIEASMSSAYAGLK